jgi:hypothetical protein
MGFRLKIRVYYVDNSSIVSWPLYHLTTAVASPGFVTWSVVFQHSWM